MAVTTRCPKAGCDSSSFELAMKTKVRGCQHQIAFIQCSACGAAISAFSVREDYILEQVAKKLGIR
ncbi:hypothetical protein [Proteus mirabilis]|uniref:hypothetical protein n=1 Tax=Proteus mirabilis TaxID=584 RepID=UPI000BC9D31B|nr:hypothetical protein [Proteus mirabilis]EKV6230412.1 hypothetical protein [Proteus mirabilis]EKW2644110.1 hypothetical protein [Proteus mirabilis]ELW9236161.1 hypothetical protein [Proteus mirabilis]EME2731687.1 hypothetical protein [Proteus mirabilis]MBG2743605.1 hypothetical protein [Proteus mirabilis]